MIYAIIWTSYGDSMERKDQKTLNIVVAILLILFVGFVVWLIGRASDNGDAKKPAPALDVSVTRKLDGITISNNEAGSLTGCKITINGDYSANVETVDGQERTYPYTSFTDGNSKRFDIVTTQPKSLNIHGCQENPDRFAAYTW